MASSTYHEGERAIHHPGVFKLSLQYDGWPDRHFGAQVGRWNIGCLDINGGEVCEDMRRRNDVYCLQEVRCCGHGPRMLGVEGWMCSLWLS